MHACNVHVCYRLEAVNKFSIYNDLKIELTYKIKIQPVGLFIWTSSHNDKYEVHHCKPDVWTFSSEGCSATLKETFI